MEYNTLREHLIMPEYGRHIQNLVNHARTLDDKEKRQDVVDQIIEMMGFLNPGLKTVADFKHKLWDHIYTISDFKLDCDSPYPMPEREQIYAKPKPFSYPDHKIKYRHYGMNLEAMIKKAIEMEDEEKKAEFTKLIANFMKRTYANYNKDGVNDEIIKEDLVRISGGKLELDEDYTIRVKNMGSSNNNKNRGRRKGGSNNRNRNNNNRKRHRR